MATETSAYVTWIPRGNRGFPIQSFRVEFKKLKGKGGGEWEEAVTNIPPQRLSVEITGLEKGELHHHHHRRSHHNVIPHYDKWRHHH